jgi:DNA-binding response OmpR family regulator
MYVTAERRSKMERKKKILVADDDPHVHGLVTHILSSDEFEIIHAYDGQETLECVYDELPDLIVLDIVMPLKDGRDICQELKKNSETRDIKILMLSAKAQQSDRMLGFELGADDYITKPFSPSYLSTKIKRMLEKS